MNKPLFAILAVLATSSMLTIGCGTTADFTETDVDWLADDGPTESEPELGAAYMESETSWVRVGTTSSDLTETEEGPIPTRKK